MIKTMLFQKKKNGKVGENQCFIESVACIIIHMLNLSKVSIFACGISVNINTWPENCLHCLIENGIL